MSNPDFPGPSWQDRPGYRDEPPAYGGDYRDNGDYPAGGGHRKGDNGRTGGYRDVAGGTGYDRSDDSYGGRDSYRRGAGGRGTGGAGGARDRFRAGRDALRNGRDNFRRGDRYGERADATYGGPAYQAGSYESYGDYAGEATGGVGGAGYDDFSGGRREGYDSGLGRARTAVRRGSRGDYEGPGGPRRPGGPGGRRPGTASKRNRPWQLGWWKHWTWRKAGIVTGVVAAATALAMIAAFFALYSMVSVPVQLLSAQVLQSSTVYFADGKTQVGCFCSSTSTTNVLTEDQVKASKNLYEAVMAAEDRSFFTEGGISISGLLRAMKSTFTGSGIQGGSTLTEQLVKTVYTQPGMGNLTYKQKIEEIFVAIKLAKVKDKWWILTHYLNDVYLGSGANGAGDAAEIYFGVPAWKLNIAQAAMIAAMIQAPGAFDPYNPHAVVGYLGYSLWDRWHNETVPNLVRDGVITQAQADAMQFPQVRKPSTTTSAWSGYRGYIMYSVENELQNTYGYKDFNQISGAGLRIVTTFSKAKMDALYATVRAAKQEMGGLPRWARLGAILENPRTGAIEAMYAGPGTDLPKAQCLALDCSVNMAQGARNQVGSSFKPYVLATAVLQGMNVETSKLNGTSPLCVPPDDTQVNRTLLATPAQGKSCPPQWALVTPDNATRNGPVTVAAATAASSNPAYVDLAHFVGTDNVVRMADSLGVNISAYPQGSNLTNMLHQTGIALGIASLTVQEQASTFATFANNGVYIKPHVIAQLSKDGVPVTLNIQTRQVLSPAQAASVNWALSFDTNSASGYTGTGAANGNIGRPTIAKTGTTDNSQGAYFIGALPTEYSFAVGMFTKSPSDTRETLSVLPSVNGYAGGYGGGWPAHIWQMYMSRVLSMDNPPVVPILAPQLDPTVFSTWIRALPVQQNCKPAKGGHKHGGPGGGQNSCCQSGGNQPGGGGQGNGQQSCPSQSPSPSPTVTLPSGTPTPTPTVTLPTPSPPFTIPPPG